MTSNEVAPLSEADILPAGSSLARTPDSSTAVAQLMQHAEAMNVAYELADKMCRTALVPAIYRSKPDDATAAILYGAELGLNPIQSLQQIFVVHGMPAIYARTMVALMKSKGHKVWTVESSDESVTVAAQRENESHVEESTWTIERAVQPIRPDGRREDRKLATNANGKLIGNEKYLKIRRRCSTPRLHPRSAGRSRRTCSWASRTPGRARARVPEPIRAKPSASLPDPSAGWPASRTASGSAGRTLRPRIRSRIVNPRRLDASVPGEKVDTAADAHRLRSRHRRGTSRSSTAH
ncbi:hypothetical protein GS941_02020 [Rhodococcus hoagii]|nr:hypothetical protein [Prescottella equi]